MHMWAVWEPVQADADPLVPAGNYGSIRFSLYVEVSATTLVSTEWVFQGNATTGRWRASTRTAQVAALLPRIIMPVVLDGATCRLTADQLSTINWRAALIQLPNDRFAVVCFAGVLRRARFSRLVPLTANLPQAGTAAAVNDTPLELDDVLLPGTLPNGSVSPGIRTLDDLNATDRERMLAVATARHRAVAVPTYAIRLPDMPGVAPVVAQAQVPPVQVPTRTAYENLIPDVAVGTQWNVSLFVGSSTIFERATIEMSKPGFVKVVSGRNAGQELEWPSPPTTQAGLPIRFVTHSGPTRPAERQDTSSYDTLSAGLLSATDLLTWGLFLDAIDADDVENRMYQFRMFLERSFNISPTDVLSKCAILRDDLIAWGRRCAEVDWRSSVVLLNEGRMTLRRLRIAHMERTGYDVSTLTPQHDQVKDDIEKEKNKQDAARRTSGGGKRPPRSSSSNLVCFSCKTPGHVSRHCPQRSQPKQTSTQPSGGTQPASVPYNMRECQYCFEHGLKFKGHFSENCFIKNPGLKSPAPSGFPSGGVPLRK